jgi:hypothetical protein
MELRRLKINKLNCTRYEKHLSSYIDKELANKRILPLEAHLHICPLCKQEYVRLVKTKQKLSTLADMDLSPELEQKLAAYLSPGYEIPHQYTIPGPGLTGVVAYLKNFFTPPRLALAGGLLSLVFIVMGVFRFMAPPITITTLPETEEIALERLMGRHMESVYETTSPANQRGIILIYNRTMQNNDLSQQVHYEK